MKLLTKPQQALLLYIKNRYKLTESFLDIGYKSHFLLNNTLRHIFHNHMVIYENGEERARNNLLQLHNGDTQIVDYVMNHTDRRYGAKNDILPDQMALHHILSLYAWIKYGYISIKLEKDDWTESFSVETLSEIPLHNIKFPYKSFSIDTSNYDWSYNGEKVDRIIFSMFDKTTQDDENDANYLMVFVHPDRLRTADSIIAINSNYSLKENIDGAGDDFGEGNHDDVAFLLGRVISVAMYMEHFKLDKSRVIAKTIKIERNPKEAVFRDVVTREYKLVQPKSETAYSIDGKGRSKNSVSFVVRGHWRNQSYKDSETKERYNKPKWIDPYFKGEGKEMFQKNILLKGEKIEE